MLRLYMYPNSWHMGSLNLFCRSEPYTNKVERHLVTVEALESSGGNQVTRKSNKLLSKKLLVLSVLVERNNHPTVFMGFSSTTWSLEAFASNGCFDKWELEDIIRRFNDLSLKN
ncbi:uncharacterized protein LOC111905400 [Lactuca sativa]|uniref:uncharacterized protein LOC111905400 n=1 Tax=Lactuca sativa TaxID=4236 RepID=UPI000CD95221|nr:uncharacterized protein LOC111905400 [Lactuca sativa]